VLPVVVIAGRPNVGKSTLFNRLAGRRLALISDVPGVTRDRNEAEVVLLGCRVRLVDTAGLEEAPPGSLAGRMGKGAATAAEMATLVLFVVDSRSGVTPVDRHFARWLRRLGRPVVVVANKAEGRLARSAGLDAFELGLGEPLTISAEHGHGISELLATVIARLSPGEASEPAVKPLQLAIVGRPNVGKSTLVNRLFGEERMLTGPEPGLTRDAISVVMADREGPVQLVDTAGVRRRARIEAPLEKLAVGATIGALKRAEVVVLVADATDGIRDQDLHIAQLIEREGRACVLVLSKWDAVANRAAALRSVVDQLETSLVQLRGITVVPLSALTGVGVDRLLPAVRRAYSVWNTRLSTAALNRWLEQALERHPPPLVSGRKPKLRYITQAKARPPTFVAFGTRVERVPEDYQRYLINSLRDVFDLPGTPIRLQFRGTRNPYAER
jgi:GTP-binding protein